MISTGYPQAVDKDIHNLSTGIRMPDRKYSIRIGNFLSRVPIQISENSKVSVSIFASGRLVKFTKKWAIL